MARRLIPAQQVPAAVSTVAGWLVDEWAHLYPGWDHAAAVAELTERGAQGRPPQTWLLLDDGPDGTASVIGSVGLGLEGELEAPLPDGDAAAAEVWVVNLYVAPWARHRGHGTALLEHAVGVARSLAIGELLLTTEHSADHYTTVGWRRVAMTTLNGHESVVMRLSTMGP